MSSPKPRPLSTAPPASPQEVARSKTVIRHTLEILGLILLALLLWKIAYALILVFGGVLLAVLLRGLAGKVRDWTGLPMGWALGLVGAVLVGGMAMLAIFLGPGIGEQFEQLWRRLADSVDRVEESLRQFALGRQLMDAVEQSSTGEAAARAVSSLTLTASKVVNGLVALLVVLFAGVFFATAPHLYTEGLVRLLPKRRHERAREVLAAAGAALWLWLLGQFVTMALVGILTALGLYLIGVPLAPVLGLITALVNFVPYFGPIVAAVPAVLLALAGGVETAVYTVLLFLVIQQVEGNMITPLIQGRAVRLPPVLVLFGAVAAGLLFGVAGVVVATPLTVVATVAVKMLYQEDVLGEPTQVPGRDAPG